MPRIFFQRAPGGFRTVQGEVIKKIQLVLICGCFLTTQTTASSAEIPKQRYEAFNNKTNFQSPAKLTIRRG